MIERWTWPAYVAVLAGAGLFAALFVPIVAWQSRRYGRLSFRRLLGAAALAVYGVALVAYTLLPLPSGEAVQWCAAHAVDGAQTEPFAFLDDVRRDTAGIGWRARLLHPTVLQVVLNVALFVPWGLLWRRFLGRGVLTATLSAFAASCLIELTQYTGLLGLVPCAYRVADVDDVLANSGGALVGAVVAPLLLAWMPQARDLARVRHVPRPVTVWRRWVGMGLDAVLFLALGSVLSLAGRLALALTGRDVVALPGWWEWVLGGLVPLVLVFVLPACAGSRASVGQRVMWLTPVVLEDDAEARAGAGAGSGYVADGPDGGRHPGAWRALARAAVTGGLWGLLSTASLLPTEGPDALGDLWADVAEVAGTVAPLVAVLAVAGVVVTRGRRGLSCALAGLDLVDSRR